MNVDPVPIITHLPSAPAADMQDEIAHVALLREALGAEAVPIPAINITGGFAAAADAAVNATLVPSFNPYANDVLFYHAVYVFEDVGVTGGPASQPAGLGGEGGGCTWPSQCLAQHHHAAQDL
jgi:hypothetical protein